MNWDGICCSAVTQLHLNAAFEVCSLHIGKHLVSQKAAFWYPNTFFRARIKKAEHVVVSCLILGMSTHKLRYVPAFKMKSINNNGRCMITWKVHPMRPELSVSVETFAWSLSSTICPIKEIQKKYLEHAMAVARHT